MIGSVLCGLAPTVYWLIGFRVLQAVGAAMMMALGTAIVTEAFPPTERGRALGIMGSIVSIGIVIGPVLGGILISGFSWRWIFFVNLPIGIIGMLMVARFVPDLKPAGRQRFDYLGAFTVVIAVERATGSNEIADYAGLTRRSPWLAVALGVFFLSLVGIPPTGGFLGKLLIFSAAIRLQYYALAVIGVINGVISVYYYYGVMRQAFFLPPTDETPIAASPSLRVALAVTLVMTLGTAIFAQPFIRLATTAATL